MYHENISDYAGVLMDNLFSKKELIYTIYREKSFSKAAQKLFIAQPSLSLMVRKIEEQIGIPLFDRSSKPIQLTEAGREYIAAVEAMRHIESSFENYIESTLSLETGALGVGSNQLLSSLVLPRYVHAFKQQYPGIQLTLLDANSTTLENKIMAGELDIIIDNHPLPQSVFERKRLTAEHLLLAVPIVFPENEDAQPYRLTYADVMAEKHLSPSLKAVPLDIFAEVPFVLMNRDNDTRKQSNAIFQEAGFDPQIVLELDRLATLYSYVALGLGASIVSDTLVKNLHTTDHEKILFYPLPSRHAHRDIYVSYKRGKYYSKAMERFIQSLGELD